jgi:hypothetical protein
MVAHTTTFDLVGTVREPSAHALLLRCTLSRGPLAKLGCENSEASTAAVAVADKAMSQRCCRPILRPFRQAARRFASEKPHHARG